MRDGLQALHSAFSVFADEPALITPERTFTFRELNDESSRIAEALGQQGRSGGDRLAILLPPSAQYVALLLACMKLGLTACPLSTRLPQEGVERALNVLRAKNLVCEDVLFDLEEYGDVHRKALPATEGYDASSSCVMHAPETQPEPRQEAPHAPAGASESSPGIHSWGCESTQSPSPVGMTEDTTAAVAVFTSGSSGTPKAALLTLDNLCANAAASNRNIPVGPGDRWLLSLPLYHVSGLGVVFRCLLGGGSIVVPARDEDLTEAIERHSVTHVSLVPTQLRRALRKDPAPLQHLKAILLGGSSVPDNLIAESIAARLPIFRTYGLTETASQVTTTRPEDGPGALYTSGKPIAPDTIALSDDGEILVRGDILFAGYIHGDAIDRPLTPHGWFATRDVGHFDAHGNLVVTGRKDNMFISGGENIQPEEIEAALCRIEGVLQAVVVPTEDAEFGQHPVAFVETEGIVEPERLRQELARTLPNFKIPKDLFPWPAECAASDAKVNRAAFAQFLKRPAT